jgi:DNA-binding NtrC family response regulator
MHADQALAEMCLQQGAVEVLLKPLKPDAVSRVIQQHCAHRVSELDTPSAVQSAVGDATVGKVVAPVTLCDCTFTPVNFFGSCAGKKVQRTRVDGRV